jgi:CheY-like chemotaxis protein
MDGWEVLRRKRRDAAIAEIPVVVLSAVPPASLDGADEVLRKPVDLRPLEMSAALLELSSGSIVI